MSNFHQFLLALLLPVIATSCGTTQNFSPEEAPDYMVIRDYTPFFRTGPMQSRGPDASLPTQTRVKVFRLEMGYSLVQLDDLRTGYVANENIAVAPPRRPEKEEPEPARRSRSSSSSSNGERFRGEELNDIPLPDPVSPPDLNIAPEDVVVPPAEPEATPEKPNFRF